MERKGVKVGVEQKEIWKTMKARLADRHPMSGETRPSLLVSRSEGGRRKKPPPPPNLIGASLVLVGAGLTADSASLLQASP